MYLFGTVRVVANKYKLVDTRGLDLLHLAGDEHAPNADELQPAAGDAHVREEAIDDVCREEEGLAVQVELFHDVHEPVNEHGAHRDLQRGDAKQIIYHFNKKKK